MGKLMAVAIQSLFLCAVGLSLTLLVPVMAFAQTSTVSITPTQGPPGATLTGSGTNWRSGDRMQISWDGATVLANTTVGSGGTFSTSFSAPSDATQGAHNIYFTDLDSRYFLVAVFTVGAAQTQPYTATITVPSSGKWVNTGISFGTESQLSIAATGSWSADPSNGYTGPDGYMKPWPDNFLNLEDIGACAYCASTLTPQWGALVGYIGNSPPAVGSYTSTSISPEAEKVFFVGSNFSVSMARTGTLWLNFNDDAYSGNTADNAGQVTATATLTPTTALYVALGDSYSSGEGAPVIDSSGNAVFIDGTDTAENECHRSMIAYPELIKESLGISDKYFKFGACSGAKVINFFPGHEQYPNEPPQLDAISSLERTPPSPSAHVQLITLSIGGNDFGFEQILQRCISGAGNYAIGPFGGPWGEYRSVDDCEAFAQSAATSGIISLELSGSFSLSALYEAIHEHAPEAKIRVLLYPHLFSPNIVGGHCVVHPAGLTTGPEYGITAEEAQKLNEVANTLNSAINSQINKAKNEVSDIDIEPIDPNEEFDGHRLCDVGESWINGLILDPISQFPFFKPSKFSFHPNAEGQKHLANVFMRNRGGM